jgi:hypothetical protein
VTDAGARVGVVVAYSALQALLIALLAEVILGYEGHRFLIIWGWGALLSAACMGSTAESWGRSIRSAPPRTVCATESSSGLPRKRRTSRFWRLGGWCRY